MFPLHLIIAILWLVIPAPTFAKVTEEDKADQAQRKLEQMLQNLEADNYIPFEQAVYFFEQMGKNATPHLVEIIHDKGNSKRLRINVIYTLGRMGESARGAVPAIIPFLRDDDPDFRAVAAISLGKIGKGADDSVTILSQLLFDNDKWVSSSAMKALRSIGTEKALDAVKSFEELRR